MKQTQREKYSRKAETYQQLVLPIAQNIEIAEDEAVFVANAQLEELDYRKLYRAYSPTGRKSAAEPRIMFKLLVYGYMCGIYSTRITVRLPGFGAERPKMQSRICFTSM